MAGIAIVAMRVDEARREPAEPAVAEAGVGLLLEEFGEPQPLVPGGGVDQGRQHQVRDVVRQRPADQELHREVVDLLGIDPVVLLLGPDPALGEHVADRGGDGLELLAGPGVLRVDDVVEHQPSLVQGVVRAGEPDGPTPVPGEEVAEAVALGAGGPNGPCWGGSLGSRCSLLVRFPSAVMITEDVEGFGPDPRGTCRDVASARTARSVGRDPTGGPVGAARSLPRLGDVVPEADDRFVAVLVLEAEHAHAGGAAVEEPPGARRQAEPAGRDHPDDVPARERQHVPLDAPHPGDEAVGPGGDVPRRFASGQPSRNNSQPGRSFRMCLVSIPSKRP